MSLEKNNLVKLENAGYCQNLQSGFELTQFTGDHGYPFIFHDCSQNGYQNITKGDKYNHPKFYRSR